MKLPSLRSALLAISLGLAFGGRIDAQDAENLMLIDLRVAHAPGDVVPGFDVGYPGWTGNRTKYPNPKVQGFDGVRIVGHGAGATRIHGTETSIFLGYDVGIVQIEHVTIECGSRFGIIAGSTNDDPQTPNAKRPLQPDALLRLYDSDVETRPAGPGETFTGTWAIKTGNVDLDFRRVRVDVPRLREHFLYAHGFAQRGAYFSHVTILRVGAEGLKFSTRPWEVWFVEGAAIRIEDCEIRGWFMPWSHRGGAGMTCQGSGAEWIIVERTVFVGRPSSGPDDAPESKCAMFDDGLSTIQDAENNRLRYYSIPDGTPGGAGAANGHIVFDRCAFQGFGEEAIRVGTIYPGYEELGIPKHAVALSFTMRNCAAYGPAWRGMPTRISLQDIKDQQIQLSGVNAEALRRYVDARYGFDTSVQATFNGSPLSQAGR